MRSTLKQSLKSSIIACGITQVTSYIKLSYMLGTLHTFFSASQIAAPLTGAFGGPIACFFTYLTRSIIYGTFHSGGLLAILQHLPTFCASLYMVKSNNVITKISIPFICMLLFIMHPIGMQASPYILFWFIPIVIAYSKTHSIFARALGATFTAHAVGSILFLYTKVTNPSLWLGLMLIVPLERITYATGMNIIYIIVNNTMKTVTRIKSFVLTTA